MTSSNRTQQNDIGFVALGRRMGAGREKPGLLRSSKRQGFTLPFSNIKWKNAAAGNGRRKPVYILGIVNWRKKAGTWWGCGRLSDLESCAKKSGQTGKKRSPILTNRTSIAAHGHRTQVQKGDTRWRTNVPERARQKQNSANVRICQALRRKNLAGLSRLPLIAANSSGLRHFAPTLTETRYNEKAHGVTTETPGVPLSEAEWGSQPPKRARRSSLPQRGREAGMRWGESPQDSTGQKRTEAPVVGLPTSRAQPKQKGAAAPFMGATAAF